MYRSGPSPSPLVLTAVDGSVSAYVRATGELAWSFRVPDDAMGFRHATRLVVDDQNVVIAAARMNERGFFANADATLHLCCLDYGTGRVRWQHQVQGGHNIAHFTATLLIDGGQVFLVHGAGLLAFALETGQLMWRQRVDGALSRGDIPVPVAIAIPGFAEQGDAK